MNKWSEENLTNLHFEHAKMLDAKYRKGDKEHNGDLRDMSLKQAVDEAIEENIDQYVFLMKIKENL